MQNLKNNKCLTCGGDVILSEDGKHGECSYCHKRYEYESGLTDDKSIIDYEQATEYWHTFRFADAKRKFLDVANANPEFSEAWWGAFVSEYGIEFVTNKFGGQIPTCHRAHTVSVFDDENYKKAVEYADDSTKQKYRELGEKIETIRKGIIEKSNAGEIYDIFICFKATEVDDDRRKTMDYDLGKEIYSTLNKDGYRVFFAPETLLQIAEQEYEPYIYRALSTAKVMFLLCSDNREIESAWVKNEWSRFLDLHNGQGLIPICGNKFEPYSPNSLPEELRKLNAIEYNGRLFEQLLTKIRTFFPEIIQKEPKEKHNDNKTDKRNSIKNNDGRPIESTVLMDSLLSVFKDYLPPRIDKAAENNETADFIIKNGELRKYNGKEKNVIIPSGITRICGAFMGNDRLESVIIPQGVTDIGMSAFRDCRNLKAVTIPNSVNYIGLWAFTNCEKLQSVVFPDSITYIDGGAFCNCSSLSNIAIPLNTLQIGGSAFANCDSIKRVCWNAKKCNQAGTLREEIFDGCLNLTEVTIGNEVKTIASYTFANCFNLKDLIIPEGVVSIGDRSFYNCENLISVKIPKSIKSIGKFAFDGCNTLKKIFYQGSKISFKAIHKGHYCLPAEIKVYCLDGVIEMSF